MPEALPTDQQVKESPLKKLTSVVFRKKTAIQEIVREPTSGGIVFRLTADKKDVEISGLYRAMDDSERAY